MNFSGNNQDMKVAVALLFIMGTVAVLAFGGLGMGEAGGKEADEFLRLHIRANSNSVEDQDVKYAVKQEILNQFTPIFSQVTSREQAIQTLDSNLKMLETIAGHVIMEHGFDYGVRIFLKSEYFPERSYNGFTLPQGHYDALIIELGEGTGDNWWCVVYPPLCFLDNNIGGERGVVYRSRLQEIIRRFF